MGKLSNTAKEAFEKNQRRGEMPWWLPRLGLVMGAVLVVFALWPSGGGGDAEDATGTTVVAVETPGGGGSSEDASREDVLGGIWEQVVTGDDAPSTTAPDESEDPGDVTPTSVDEGGGGDGTLTEVDRSDGSGRVALDPAAYPAAVAAVRERLGGAAEVLVPTADSAGPDQVVFRLSVDPDGEGSQGVQVVTVTVVRRGALWRAEPIA